MTDASQKIDVPGTTYDEIVQFYAPRAICDDDGFRRTVGIIENLVKRPMLNDDQSAYLETLGDLGVAYERRLYPPKKFSQLEALRYLIVEQHSMNGTGLGKFLGCSPSTGQRLLNGSRKLTAKQILILSNRFHLAPEYFFDRSH